LGWRQGDRKQYKNWNIDEKSILFSHNLIKTI